jgi:hypothetical protein
MERGVGAAGNGMGLLNGQTTRQNSKLWRRGEGLFTFKTAGIKDNGTLRQVNLDNVLKVFREMIRGFHDLLRKKLTSLLIL